MTTKQDVKNEIAAGAALLDEKEPEWFAFPFDWEKYDIASSFDCLLGQLWVGREGGLYSDPTDAPYTKARDALGITLGKPYGFARQLWVDDVAYADVNVLYRKLWKKEVDKRLKNVVIVTREVDKIVEVPRKFSDDEKRVLKEILEAYIDVLEADMERVSVPATKRGIQAELDLVEALGVELGE